MSFLYPTFLWALTALSIPIIIHLFNFRKTTRVFFSNTRFLKHVKEVTTAKRRLKHWLILASRLLALLFLVFAFAQPVIPARETLGNHRKVIIYLDNSFSMSAPLEDNTRGLDAAVTFCRDIVELFPVDTHYKLITNDFAPFSNSFKPRKEIQDLLADIKFSSVSRTMEEVKNRIKLNAEDADDDVFWISDFQKSTVGKIALVPADTSRRWHLVPIGYKAASNVFVDSVYLQDPFSVDGEKNVLHVSLRNLGEDAREAMPVKLTINGILTGTATTDIDANASGEVMFDLATELRAFNKAVVRVNDFPISFDNDFFLALNVTGKVKIVEIKESNTVTPVEKVYSNSAMFDFKSQPVSNFNYSLLRDADLVVLNGLDNIEASLAQAVESYERERGSLLIIPGKKPDVVTYSKIAGRQVSWTDNKQKQVLNNPDYNHPMLANVFEEKSTAVAMPAASVALQWGVDRSAILKFKTDEPFLSGLTQGGGKVFLLSCPLEPEYTEFYNHALFVPVMYRLAASSKHDINPLYYPTHQNYVEMRVDSLDGEEPVRLMGEQEVVPTQRILGNNLLLELPKFSINTGFYNVVVHRDTVGLLAFNSSKQESFLAQYRGEEVQKQLNGGERVTLFDAHTTDTFSNEIKARYLGDPLWKYAIIAALFFLLVEILLIRFLK